MIILLKKHDVYPWTTSDAISFRGYLQKKDGSVLKGKDAISLFASISDMTAFKVLLNNFYGSFSVIINKDYFHCAAVDIARSMPLFYNTRAGIISDSAEIIRKELGVKKEDVDEFLLSSMTAISFLVGNDTVYNQIKQLDLGQYIIFDEEKPQPRYYFHHLNNIVELNPEAIKKQLTETAYNVFTRIKEVIGDRPVVLSMSGGYDSRFVACMLKNVGVKDISGYSYGKAGVFEAEQAKKNAEALGIRWTFVEYTDDLVNKVVDEEGQKYLDSYDGHDYSAYIQNYPAVRKLHEKGWFKPNSVFLTGLCGDMPTGEYVVKEDAIANYNSGSAAEHIYRMLSSRYSMKENYKIRFIHLLKEKLDSLPISISDYQSWTTATDAVYTGTSHIHAFMKMNYVHEFFGYEWLLPYWDKEMLKLWYSVPAKYRYGQKLYEDWLMDEICKPYGLNTRKVNIGYPASKWKKKLVYLGGSILMMICMNLGIVLRRRYDFLSWASLELELFNKLESKKMIHYGKASVTNLLVRYCFQRRYGANNVLKAQKNLRMPQI